MKKFLLALMAVFTAFSSTGIQAFASESTKEEEVPHIVIDAQSNKYEQLGYLIAKVKTDVILTNVISTAGQKDNGVITVRVEGDLP